MMLMKMITDETMQLPSRGDGVRFVSVELQIHPQRGRKQEEKRKMHSDGYDYGAILRIVRGCAELK